MPGGNVSLCMNVLHTVAISDIKRQLPANILGNYKAKPSLGIQEAFHKPRVSHGEETFRFY